MNAPDTPPAFPSTSDYLGRLDDIGFWFPRAAGVFQRHGIDVQGEAVAGLGGTFPTLLSGNVAIKLFGHLPFWRAAYEAERDAVRCVATDPGILAPTLLGEGRLYDDPNEPWPYLLTTRTTGAHWEDARLSRDEKATVAAELGRQVRRVHALVAPSDLATPDVWARHRLSEAASKTVLPPNLVSQVDDFARRSGSTDPVFVHGDLMYRHVFVEGGRLAGIIDWGDALVTDRHYELAQVQLNLFNGDKALLRTFLDHSSWPVEHTFARRALAQAFHRQAVGLAQHLTMDVFYKVPDLVPLEGIATLDELAEALFGV